MANAQEAGCTAKIAFILVSLTVAFIIAIIFSHECRRNFGQKVRPIRTKEDLTDVEKAILCTKEATAVKVREVPRGEIFITENGMMKTKVYHISGCRHLPTLKDASSFSGCKHCTNL